MKSPPKPAAPPSTPTTASFISRGSTGQPGFGQRPNKFGHPVMGMTTSNVGRPSLIGGA